MQPDKCPHCGQDLKDEKCLSCGYIEPKCMTRRYYRGGHGGGTTPQQRAMFAEMKRRGTYIPDYHGRREPAISVGTGMGIARGAIGAAATSTAPTTLPVIASAEFAAAGLKELNNAVSDVRAIWSTDKDIDTKVSKIADRFAEAGANTIVEGVKQTASTMLSNALVDAVGQTGIFANIERATGVNGIGDACKDMLRDTVKEQILRLE